jgi:hypothetical protein
LCHVEPEKIESLWTSCSLAVQMGLVEGPHNVFSALLSEVDQVLGLRPNFVFSKQIVE